MQIFSSDTIAIVFLFCFQKVLEMKPATQVRAMSALCEIWTSRVFPACPVVIPKVLSQLPPHPGGCGIATWAVLHQCAKNAATMGRYLGRNTTFAGWGTWGSSSHTPWDVPSSQGSWSKQARSGQAQACFLQRCCIYLRGHTKSWQLVDNCSRLYFSAGGECISARSLDSCWRKMSPASHRLPPSAALAAVLSTSNSSTSQTDIIRNPKVNNLIISSARRLVRRRSDSRKSAARIHAGKMPDFKKETGRQLEERALPDLSLVTYFGPSALQ